MQTRRSSGRKSPQIEALPLTKRSRRNSVEPAQNTPPAPTQLHAPASREPKGEQQDNGVVAPAAEDAEKAPAPSLPTPFDLAKNLPLPHDPSSEDAKTEVMADGFRSPDSVRTQAVEPTPQQPAAPKRNVSLPGGIQRLTGLPLQKSLQAFHMSTIRFPKPETGPAEGPGTGLHLLSEAVMSATITDVASRAGQQKNPFEQSFEQLVANKEPQGEAAVEASSDEGKGRSQAEQPAHSAAPPAESSQPAGSREATPMKDMINSYFDLPLASGPSTGHGYPSGGGDAFPTSRGVGRGMTGFTPWLFPNNPTTAALPTAGGLMNLANSLGIGQGSGFTPLFGPSTTMNEAILGNEQAPWMPQDSLATEDGQDEEESQVVEEGFVDRNNDIESSRNGTITPTEAARALQQQQRICGCSFFGAWTFLSNTESSPTANEEGASLAQYLMSQSRAFTPSAQALLWTPSQTPATGFSTTPQGVQMGEGANGLGIQVVGGAPFGRHQRMNSMPAALGQGVSDDGLLHPSPVILRRASDLGPDGSSLPQGFSHATSINFGFNSTGQITQPMSVTMPPIPSIPGYRFVPSATSGLQPSITHQLYGQGHTATERAGFSFSHIMGIKQEPADEQLNPLKRGRPGSVLAGERINLDTPTPSADDKDSEYSPKKKKKRTSGGSLPVALGRRSERPKRSGAQVDMLSSMLEHPDFVALDEQPPESTKAKKGKGGARRQVIVASGEQELTVKRLERRRERNRTAARRSRERRVKYMDDLEQEWVWASSEWILLRLTRLFRAQDHPTSRRKRPHARSASRTWRGC